MNTPSLIYQRRWLKGGASQILFAGALIPGAAHQPKELRNPWSTQTGFCLSQSSPNSHIYGHPFVPNIARNSCPIKCALATTVLGQMEGLIFTNVLQSCLLVTPQVCLGSNYISIHPFILQCSHPCIEQPHLCWSPCRVPEHRYESYTPRL